MNDKKIFTDYGSDNTDTEFMPKRTFDSDKIELDDVEVIDDTDIQPTFEPYSPSSPRWKTWLILTALLFLAATVAQSVQWIIESWQQHQWINLAFIAVMLSIVFMGSLSLWREWRRLVQLKKRMLLQQQSRAFLPMEKGQNQPKSAVDFSKDFNTNDQSHEKAVQLCQDAAQLMNIPSHYPPLLAWQQSINESHTGQEVVQLFNQTMMPSLDQQAKKMISKSAVEAALIVAISPLALVDMFFIAWRNIRLVNQLAKLYGIEVGYWSRIRLLKMVLLNIAFAGATEVVQDIGMDWLSQDISAKVSARIAQGMGVGLLTARLGIKTLEFCRPIPFASQDKLRLSHIQRELLSQLKGQIFTSSKAKETQKL